MSTRETGNGVQQIVYPMWVMVCDHCGVVGTLFEKPGTGCSYVRHCIECGGRRVHDERADCDDDVQSIKQREARK